MSTTSRFATCFCPVCPARKGGTCGVVLDASFDYGVVCPCTSGCNRQFPECCYVDSDGEVTNCCDDCGGGSHRVCSCCGEQGDEDTHDRKPYKQKKTLRKKTLCRKKKPSKTMHTKRQVA